MLLMSLLYHREYAEYRENVTVSPRSPWPLPWADHA